MQITINNKTYELPQGAVLPNVLSLIGIQSDAGTALAVNNSVIPRSKWDDYELAENDSVIVIRAIQGG